MSDYYQLVQRLRTCLSAPSSGGGGADDGFAEHLTAYSTTCAEAHARLARCADYLRRGRRSEALHLADASPRLAELVPALQIDEWDDLRKRCDAEGLTAPQRLAPSDLQPIEEARQPERALALVLARQRALALARAPLTERLDVVRELVRKDPENPGWREGLAELEVARVQQLRAQARAAFVAGEVETLDQIRRDVGSEVWSDAVVHDFRTTLAEALAFARRRATLEEMRELLPQIADLLTRPSYDGATGLLSSWQEILATLEGDLPADLQDAIRPLSAWLVSEERRRESLHRRAQLPGNLEAADKVLRRRVLRRRWIVWTIIALACVSGGIALVAYFRLI